MEHAAHHHYDLTSPSEMMTHNIEDASRIA